MPISRSFNDAVGSKRNVYFFCWIDYSRRIALNRSRKSNAFSAQLIIAADGKRSLSAHL